MRVWPLSRKRAEPAPPPKDLSRISNELEQLDAKISHARTKLQGLRDVTTILELNALLRKRFFLTGQVQDITEFLALSGSVPPKLEEIGTASLTFRPELDHHEHLWVQMQPWLESQGYGLLPRYHPDWMPSWIANPDTVEKMDAEDGLGSQLANINAAVRLKDGVTVWLKFCSDLDDQETGIYLYFASEPRRSDPHNRCCPLLDILRAPSRNGKRSCILVVPLLRAMYDEPHPETAQDLMDAVLQLAKGLDYMHEHNVAHRYGTYCLSDDRLIHDARTYIDAI